MKIIQYQLKLVGVDKDKAVMIKEEVNFQNDPLQLNHDNTHQLSLTKSTNKLNEDDYELKGLREGCSLSFDTGETERIYQFILNEEFIKEFEDFLKQFIKKQINKIPNDFK